MARARPDFLPQSAYLRSGHSALSALADPEDAERHAPIRTGLQIALTMALEAGAEPPLTFVGAGATAIVFCDDQQAYKVARAERAVGLLADEAEWLETARTLPEVAPHVARFYRWDPLHGVLVRECIRGSVGSWGRDRKIREIWDRIQPVMLAAGWLMPEYKEDSFVFDEQDQPKLVDAGFASRIGNRLLIYVAQVLDGTREMLDGFDPLSDLAFYVRRELGEPGLDAELAEKLLDQLYERGASRG